MTLECTLQIPNLKNCPTKKHCYTASVATYDAFDAAHNKIPPGAHLLSQEQGLTFTIRSSTTLIPLVLQGLPATIAFIPAANTLLTGSQDAGYVEPKCSASSQTVTALGVDADGNYILGPGCAGHLVRFRRSGPTIHREAIVERIRAEPAGRAGLCIRKPHDPHHRNRKAGLEERRHDAHRGRRHHLQRRHLRHHQRVSHSHRRERPGVHRSRPRRQSLVHGVCGRPNRPNNASGNDLRVRDTGRPAAHRLASRPVRTVTSGLPNSQPAKSAS